MGLTVGPERGKLQLRLHQVFVSFLKDSGAVYCIPELNLNSNSAMEIQVIAGEEYRLHTGNQWDTTVSVTDSLFVSFSTGFSFHTDNQGQLYTKGSPNTVLTDKNRLILQTSNLWICPCHFGNRCAGVVVGETGDTIKMWKRMTVISGLAMKIRMLDSENTVLQENYFLPEKNGTLKRKHLIRIY